MSRFRQVLTTHGLDALILAAAVSSAVGTARRHDPALTGLQAPLAVGAAAAVVLVLLLRRRFPFAAPVAVWLGSAALSFVDGRLVASQSGMYFAGLGAALMLGNLSSGVQARAGLVTVLGSAAILVFNDPDLGVDDFAFVGLLFLLAWLVGYALRERAEQTDAAVARAAQAERDRDAAARVAVAEERARIARELHDVVAHAVSVMVLQVGAVRHRMPETEAENREALLNVETAGRAALSEMRRLLGAMRRDGDAAELVPHPGLANLADLLGDIEAAGLPVRLTVRGDPSPLSPGLDLSAYRIVQEALTNCLKHAHAHQAEVNLSYEPDQLRVEVSDDGGGPTSEPGQDGTLGHGHGLVGLAERAKIFGGDLTAGRSAAGGFVLRARLPLDGERA